MSARLLPVVALAAISGLVLAFIAPPDIRLPSIAVVDTDPGSLLVPVPRLVVKDAEWTWRVLSIGPLIDLGTGSTPAIGDLPWSIPDAR